MIFNYFADWVTGALVWILQQIDNFARPIFNATGINNTYGGSGFFNMNTGGGIFVFSTLIRDWLNNISWFFPVDVFIYFILIITTTEVVIWGVKIISWVVHAVSLKLVPKL
jgi:hypothetical protein